VVPLNFVCQEAQQQQQQQHRSSSTAAAARPAAVHTPSVRALRFAGTVLRDGHKLCYCVAAGHQAPAGLLFNCRTYVPDSQEVEAALRCVEPLYGLPPAPRAAWKKVVLQLKVGEARGQCVGVCFRQGPRRCSYRTEAERRQ
jgi:hypothetical protein